MGQHLHRYLEEFASEQPNSDPASLQRPQVRIAAVQSTPTPTPIPIHLDQTYIKGHEDGKQSARIQAQAELDAVLLDYQQRLARTKAQFSERLADELSDRLRAQIDRLQDSISNQLVTALLPLLRYALTEATLREMAEGLRILTADREVIHVELTGPKDLVEKVWQKYRDSRPCTSSPVPEPKIVIDEQVELRLVVNDSIMQARLVEWISKLEEVVN